MVGSEIPVKAMILILEVGVGGHIPTTGDFRVFSAPPVLSEQVPTMELGSSNLVNS